MARADVTGSGRLSVDDWLRAGFAIIAEEGIKALKLDRLCDRLGVTRGSFYWHFDGMSDYRSALVQSWAELRDEDRHQLNEMAGVPPRERLSAMMASLMSPRHWTLERAMREWARTDEAVAKSVRSADRRLRRAIRQSFLDLGFERDDAEMRADAVFAAGVGFLHLSGPKPSKRSTVEAERFLEQMLKP